MQFPDFKAKRGVYAVVESGTYEKITEKMELDEMNRIHHPPKKKRNKPNKGRGKKKSGPTDEESAHPSIGSDMFRPFHKDVVRVEGDRVIRRFYLVDVDAFMEPILVIPDIGPKDKLRYFQVTPRNKWHLDFIDWLEEEVETRKEMKRMEEEEGTKEYKLEWTRIKNPPKAKKPPKPKSPMAKKRKKGTEDVAK